MELALVFGIGMVLALRASMVGASGDGLTGGGGSVSGDECEGEHALKFHQIAQGTFEIYTISSTSTPPSTTCAPSPAPVAWVHSTLDPAKPDNPYLEYWLIPSAVIINHPNDTRLLFHPVTPGPHFDPSAYGTLSAVRTAFIAYASAAPTSKMHVHHIANVI